MKRSITLRYLIIIVVSIYLQTLLENKKDSALQSLNYLIETDATVTTEHRDIWLTVFVHGTIVLHPRFLIENIPALKKDRGEETLYGQVISDSRSAPFLFQNQAIQEPGLHIISEPFCRRGYASGALAYILEALNYRQSLNYYYTFGWSGLISESTREQAGAQLYHELAMEIERYKQKGIVPKVRVIGYSHGGNVCLNMARDVIESPWHVDELVIMGTPVQPTTDYLITNQLFKKKYVIFSLGDSVQKHDMFSSHSARYFSDKQDFDLPCSLTQIQLRIAKRVSSDHDITPREHSFFYKRPLSPGHIELWFFGWTPNYYRNRYPFYPLPTVAFVPYIIQQIQNQVLEHNPEQPLVVTIAPDQELMSIACNNADKCPIITPFIPIETLDALAETVLNEYKPHNYKKEYRKKRDKIIKKSIKRHMRVRPTASY